MRTVSSSRKLGDYLKAKHIQIEVPNGVFAPIDQFLWVQRSRPPLPTKIAVSECGLMGPSDFQSRASFDSGNAILPPETGGRFQPLNRCKGPKSGLQTAFSMPKPLNSMRFPQTQKPARFARTGIKSRTTRRCAVEFGLLEHPPLGNGIARPETLARNWGKRPRMERKSCSETDLGRLTH
jgi:hypothetical protein